MPFVDVRDTRLFYEMSGEGDPPLLFIHGAFGDAWNWSDQISQFAGDFTCVAYDRRSHSRSEAPTEQQDFPLHTEDVVSIIKALDLDRPILVGESLGGAIVAEVLHKHPEVARAAVLIEPAMFSIESGGSQEIAETLGPPIQHAVQTDGVRAVADAFFDIIAPEFWAQIGEPTRDRFRDNSPTLLGSIESEPSNLTAGDLSEIDHPVLVIVGGDSAPLIHRLTRQAAEHLPNSRLVEIEGCGHMPHFEKPAEFTQAVRAFVDEVAAVA